MVIISYDQLSAHMTIFLVYIEEILTNLQMWWFSWYHKTWVRTVFPVTDICHCTKSTLILCCQMLYLICSVDAALLATLLMTCCGSVTASQLPFIIYCPLISYVNICSLIMILADNVNCVCIFRTSLSNMQTWYDSDHIVMSNVAVGKLFGSCSLVTNAL